MKKVIAIIMCMCVVGNAVGCSMQSAKKAVNSTANEVGKVAQSAKETVVDWCSNIDFSKFKKGWDYSVEFMGSAYSAATGMSSKYVANIEKEITNLKTDMNSAAGSARGTAQEAGYLAEKWAADTFNISAAANESEYSANVENSNEFASPDVTTNYNEKVSLKYYQTAKKSASEQAKALLKAYKEFCSKTAKTDPPTLDEYLNERGYDAKTQDALLASVYEGQIRIIPTDQLAEATEYLQGKIDSLSSVEGEATSAMAKTYKETLNNLRDRLKAPDGTESKPLSYQEAQAIAEVSKDGNFRPEDFGINVTTMINPKYVMKQAVGTGLEVAAINTILTVGPDFYSIIKEAIQNGKLDETTLKEKGLEGTIAASEGFIEGSVSRVIATMCKAGTFGTAMKSANPSIIAMLTILVIEGIIHGYELSQGKITAEEYGNMMVDRLMIGLIAIPTTALFFALLPATHIAMLAGCMAGGMVACVGYMAAKNAIMDIVDGGGFEAIVPAKVTNTIRVATKAVSELGIKERASVFKDSIISTATDGYIHVSSMIKK